jgi:hypothetical protein
VYQILTDFKKAYDSVSRKFLYNIFMEYDFPEIPVRLITMCQSESCSRFWVSKHLSDMYPIRNGLKKGYALKPLLFNFASGYAFKRVQVNKDGLKLKGIHQLLVYVDDINMLGESVHNIKENADTLLLSSELEISADKSKYRVMSRGQTARGNHYIMIGNSSSARVEEFKYLGITLNQNSVQEKIRAD